MAFLDCKLNASSKTDIQSLLAWLSSNMSTISEKITFQLSATCGNTLGCFAKEDLQAETLLFTVDLQCILSVEQVLNSDVHEHIQNIAKASGNLHLATLELQVWLYMIHQRLTHSHFEPYLSTLAATSPCPFNWDTDLLTSLQGTNLEAACSDDSFTPYLQLLHALTAAAPDLFPASDYHLDALKWAKGHYISRRYPNKYSLGLHTDISHLPTEATLDSIGALVPLLDILNHKPGGEWLSLVVHNNKLEVRTMAQVAAGDEIFSNYGALSNEKLLYAYGYCSDVNADDAVAMKLMTRSTAGQQCQGTFYIRPGGVAGIPGELWEALSALTAAEGEEGDCVSEVDEEEGVVMDIENVLILRDWMLRKYQALVQSEHT